MRHIDRVLADQLFEQAFAHVVGVSAHIMCGCASPPVVVVGCRWADDDEFVMIEEELEPMSALCFHSDIELEFGDDFNLCWAAGSEGLPCRRAVPDHAPLGLCALHAREIMRRCRNGEA